MEPVSVQTSLLRVGQSGGQDLNMLGKSPLSTESRSADATPSTVRAVLAEPSDPARPSVSARAFSPAEPESSPCRDLGSRGTGRASADTSASPPSPAAASRH